MRTDEAVKQAAQDAAQEAKDAGQEAKDAAGTAADKVTGGSGTDQDAAPEGSEDQE